MIALFRKPSASSSMKGFKVTSNKDRTRKFGIAVNSLESLRAKVESKFKAKTFNLFLSDGSLIDNEDYFGSLPAQSLIIVVEEGEEVRTGKLLYSALGESPVALYSLKRPIWVD